jgi:hypothetical protein
LFDTETKQEHRVKTTLPSDQYRPYGITWNEDYIFVASKTNLLIYNSDLELIDIRRDILDFNTHQLVVRGDELIVCMTSKDCLKFINLKDLSEQLWHPKLGWLDKRETNYEAYHINTVVSYSNNLYAMLHWRNRRKSQIAVVGDDVSTINAKSAHNIYLNGETLGYVDTDRHRLVIGDHSVTCDLWETKPVFLRGLAGDDKELVVGCSNRNEMRRRRMEGDSAICVVKDGAVQSHLKLVGTGALDDIRRIDGQDFCHHNPHPFPFNW